ncbi:hypothetical protein D3C78_809720 [compost metagenome]
MAGAEAVLQRNALALAAFADAFDHQLLGHRAGELGAVVAGQQRQQQVEHRQAAAGGEAVTVPVEQVAGGDHLGEALGEVVLPAPVHRGAVAIQQAQLRQRIDPGGQAADHAAGTHQLLDGRRQCRRHVRRWLVGQQEQALQAIQLAGPGIAGQAPGALGSRFGMQERHLVNHFRMESLGNSQGFLGQRQSQRLGTRPEEKGDSMGSHGRQLSRPRNKEGNKARAGSRPAF